MFSFDRPLLVVQDDITKLWPALLVAGAMYIIRAIVNTTMRSTANDITQYKINAAKPQWLVSPVDSRQTTPTLKKNGVTSRHKSLTVRQSNKLSALIESLSQNQINKLCAYASELHLTDIQIRQLKSYFTLIKEATIHKNKFLESTFKLLCVSPIALYGIYVVYFQHDFFIHHRKQWIHFGDHNIDAYDLTQCNINHENEPLTQMYDDWMLSYYIISLGYHLNRALLQFHNPTRKDFVALVIHHWTTLALMVFSFVGGKARCGCIILSIHESADVFLESAKISKYCSNVQLANVFFVLFALSWIIMRIWCFSHKLLYELYVCGFETLFMGNAPLIFPHACVYLLCVLEALHVYWFKFILLVIVNKFKGKQIADTRSDDESDNEDRKKAD